MTEAGIGMGLSRDLYVSLGEQLDANSWSVRVYVKPYIRLVWLGAIFIALGGVTAALDKRYKKRLRQEASVEAGTLDNSHPPNTSAASLL